LFVWISHLNKVDFVTIQVLSHYEVFNDVAMASYETFLFYEASSCYKVVIPYSVIDTAPYFIQTNRRYLLQSLKSWRLDR
jgi:hypothetical protein